MGAVPAPYAEPRSPPCQAPEDRQNAELISTSSAKVLAQCEGGRATVKGPAWREGGQAMAKGPARREEGQATVKGLARGEGGQAMAKGPARHEGARAAVKGLVRREGGRAVAKGPARCEGGRAVAKGPAQREGGWAAVKGLVRRKEGQAAVKGLAWRKGGWAVVKGPARCEGGRAAGRPRPSAKEAEQRRAREGAVKQGARQRVTVYPILMGTDDTNPRCCRPLAQQSRTRQAREQHVPGRSQGGVRGGTPKRVGPKLESGPRSGMDLMAPG
ncbi:uncharacterized protein LOC115638705 [Gopherus evgoodei]|uniref:uncharacterized protein LOC115638705 n=1 Tax=Gopherus evgoodei TaxID=1825980 RepID=UPI0011CF361E|nr:uncharacterized protein LOC115638705 [Gopherus evgoodei]